MDRDYIYHEYTQSICSVCKQRVPTKIILKDGKVFLSKFCGQHGRQTELYEEDQEYYLKKRELDKPATISKTQTKTTLGCPFDCGLCHEHDQHSCISLIEVTSKCNLRCPTCFANSGEGEFLSAEKFEKMLDFLIESEGGSAEILQISGGEPTIHPDIIRLIEIARSKPIKYIMLNTNGVRIANEPEFAQQLSKFKGGFEVYMQFDSLKPDAVKHLRGLDLIKTKKKALENLAKYEVPSTLVMTIEKGINDDEIGDVIRFAMSTKYVRGVSLQPVAFFGRYPEAKTKDRVTLSGTVKRVEEQVPEIFKKGDIIPLPCNVERVAVSYLAKHEGKFVPITRHVKVKSYLPIIDNTFAFDADKILKDAAKEIITSGGVCKCMDFIRDIKNIIPLDFGLKSKQEKIRYISENTFRVSVNSFVDIYNFDMKSMQKECVHLITEDLKKIPLSAYNMFYRK